MKPIVYLFPQDAAFGRALAARLGAEVAEVDLHEFPDGEVLARLVRPCDGREAVFVCGGHRPNASALPLYFAATTARELGATRVGLCTPYLAYMRQDTRFRDGESMSAPAYARFLGNSFDWLVTVEAHLHRIESLDAVFPIPSTNIPATEALAPWIRENVANPVLVGPDRESESWTSRLAERIQAPFTVLEKVRTGDRKVSVSIPDPKVISGRTPVIVDDIASSGRTMAKTVEALLASGADKPVCIVVHAIFSGDAQEVILRSGASRIVSTNTITHATNAIDVTPMVAAAVQVQMAGPGIKPRATIA